MTEDEARDFFEHLPLDERLRLVREILGDIEGRISRARAELNGETPQLVLSTDLTPSVPSFDHSLPELESPDSPGNPDFPDFDIDELTGGSLHPVHSLRLKDAAAQYEKLLKHYGYIKGIPDPQSIVQQEIKAASHSKRHRRRTDTVWAEWVARDAETLDRPYPHEWSDWVALGDDEGGE